MFNSPPRHPRPALQRGIEGGEISCGVVEIVCVWVFVPPFVSVLAPTAIVWGAAVGGVLAHNGLGAGSDVCLLVQILSCSALYKQIKQYAYIGGIIKQEFKNN